MSKAGLRSPSLETELWSYLRVLVISWFLVTELQDAFHLQLGHIQSPPICCGTSPSCHGWLSRHPLSVPHPSSSRDHLCSPVQHGWAMPGQSLCQPPTLKSMTTCVYAWGLLVSLLENNCLPEWLKQITTIVHNDFSGLPKWITQPDSVLTCSHQVRETFNMARDWLYLSSFLVNAFAA